ncbi:hypothetical protein LLE49_10245 [Alicyclobacillus tolerans]|uniref:hypothetical protein n=1 Tax=Alicyclobacillus tolerans TaxID=90970 RepID=UPI001F286A17|nr:hypothetical protein [Alicyclobacillus tolerans]MCF8565093.1 hypothetical protein [Alicyclobacillus tolerans]
MSVTLSQLQNLLLQELNSFYGSAPSPVSRSANASALRSGSTPSPSLSANSPLTSWDAVFQQEMAKMDGMPLGTQNSSQPVSETQQTNNVPPSNLPAQQPGGVDLTTFWKDAQLHAYNQNRHAESSTDAVAQDLAVASQDAQKVAQNQYSVYGKIPVGQTELSGYEGKSFYITNVNGTLFRSAVPVAISPNYGK